MFTGKKRYWIFQLSGWGSFFLLHMFFAWVYGKFDTMADRQLFLTRAGTYILIGFTITHLVRYLIIKLKLLDKTLQQQIAIFLLFTIGTAFVCGIIEHYIFSAFKLLSDKELETISKRGLSLILMGNAFSWFLYIFMWNCIYFIYHYMRNYQQQQLDTLQLKSLVKELELKTIKSHINPHFIFNSLNSIRALVDEDPVRARNAITELSNILRSSINIHKTETIALKDELSIVEDYLALEHVRFEDRLNVQYNIQGDTLDKLVPPMMLQLMAENAIKHGISKEINGGLIKVSSVLKDGTLEMSVENTGHLNQYENNGGFGIKSTGERLRLLYGEKGNFEIVQSSPSIVKAKVTIPVSS